MRTAACLAVNIDEVGEDKERRGGGLSSEQLEREEGEAKRVEALRRSAREEGRQTGGRRGKEMPRDNWVTAAWIYAACDARCFPTR